MLGFIVLDMTRGKSYPKMDKMFLFVMGSTQQPVKKVVYHDR